MPWMCISFLICSYILCFRRFTSWNIGTMSIACLSYTCVWIHIWLYFYFIGSNTAAYEVYISQFIRYSRACVKYNDVLDSAQMPYLKWQCIFSFSCRNCLPSRAPWFTLGFWWCPCCSLFLVLCVVLFVVLCLSSSYVSCAQFCQCLWIIHCFPSVFSNVYLVYSCHFHLPWLRGKDCFNCQQKSIWNWCVTLVYYFVILTWRPSFAL
jgi:hypothetical protein